MKFLWWWNGGVAIFYMGMLEIDREENPQNIYCPKFHNFLCRLWVDVAKVWDVTSLHI